MTIACGDSHTSTHGALGAIAFGIGTSQVRDVLASQCLALDPLKVRRDRRQRRGSRRGVYAKDVILTIIRRLGVQGGVGFAYEYGGSTLDAMTIDERMTICNMSIEGGARDRLRQPRRHDVRVPARPAVRAGRRRVRSRGGVVAHDGVRRERGLRRSRGVRRRRRSSRPSPGASIPASRSPSPSRLTAAPDDEALAFMGFKPGSARAGDADRRRLHRLVHQRAPVGPRGSRAHRARPSRRAARQGAGRAGIAGGRPRGRSARTARGVHRRRVRMARRRLLDVPRHEPRPARRPPDLAPRRRTATSRGARAARPAARC